MILFYTLNRRSIGETINEVWWNGFCYFFVFFFVFFMLFSFFGSVEAQWTVAIPGPFENTRPETKKKRRRIAPTTVLRTKYRLSEIIGTVWNTNNSRSPVSSRRGSFHSTRCSTRDLSSCFTRIDLCAIDRSRIQFSWFSQKIIGALKGCLKYATKLIYE